MINIKSAVLVKSTWSETMAISTYAEYLVRLRFVHKQTLLYSIYFYFDTETIHHTNLGGGGPVCTRSFILIPSFNIIQDIIFASYDSHNPKGLDIRS